MHTSHLFGRTLERAGIHTPAFRLMAHVAIGSLMFQVVHFIEHMAHLSHSFMSPVSPAWAETGRDLLVVDGTPRRGNELLEPRRR